MLRLSPVAAQRDAKGVFPSDLRRQDGLQCLSQPSRRYGCDDIRPADNKRDLLPVPRGKTWPVLVGACTGQRGLRTVPLTTWIQSPGNVDAPRASALPELSLAVGPSERRLPGRQPGRGNTVAVLAGRKLPELPLTNSRFQSSVRFETGAMTDAACLVKHD